MNWTEANRWYKIAAFVGAVAIPLVLSIGPLAIHDLYLLATTIAGVELVYLGVLLSTVLQLHSDLDRKFKGLARVEPISEGEFYARFSAALRTARTRVKLSYMSYKSPLDTRDPIMRDYYQKLPNLVRKIRSDLEFKRLIRAVPGIRNWLEQMVTELKDVPNFSLACLVDNQPESDNITTVSVQCVDDNKVYFVAVGEQQESTGRRDLYVESEDFGKVWNQYYERLWRSAIVVIDRGRIDPANLAKVRQLVKG